MSETTLVTIKDKGAGFVTATQDAGDKQLSPKQIETFASGIMRVKKGIDSPLKEYKLITVNNGTSTMKINPRMRETRPDPRVYTLMLASKVKK